MRTIINSLRIFFGLVSFGSPERPLFMTCSISEDYARIWHYFAKKHLDLNKWNLLIIDSAGDFDERKFEGTKVIKFLNFYHGKKMDYLLRKVIKSKIVFLCDDDKYLLQDVSDHLDFFDIDRQKNVAVSFSPRTWWKFVISGREYLPMGSYALMFDREKFIEQNLHLNSPVGLKSRYKVFAAGAKQQLGYDTTDYANEQLLLAGYNIMTLPNNDYFSGFDGLSSPRILLMSRGHDYVKSALLEAGDYKEGTTSGGVMKAAYGIVKMERLYRSLFGEEPRYVSGFSEGELREVVEKNNKVAEVGKNKIQAYFEMLDKRFEHLAESLKAG